MAFLSACAPRRSFLIFIGSALMLAGCSGLGGFGGEKGPSVNEVAAQSTAVGAGSNKIALVLPLSSGGGAGQTALAMKNAAELALAEVQAADTQIIVKDDQGTPQGAAAATQAAIGEGAQIVLGPLFAPSVSAAGETARTSGVPMIGFSTDENVASPGVYLLSFLPSADVNRIVEFAATKGKRSFVGLVPDDAYGTVAEAEFRTGVTRVGGRLAGLERYSADAASVKAAVQRLAPAIARADAVFIPDGADGTGLVLQALKDAGISTANLKILGTGRWDDPRLKANPLASGGWYAAPDSAGFNAFAGRYQARYGNAPSRQASLAYDAALLSAALIKQMPRETRFSSATLNNTGGFSGVDGIFRFLPNGVNQRGIAVMEIRNGSVTAISPAPKTFSAAS